MAKKEISLEEAQEAFNRLATTGNASVTFEEAFDLLDGANDNALQELAAGYFTFEKVGETTGFVVEGFDTFQKDGKTVEVVKLRNRNGESFVNGDKVLVSACKRLGWLPMFVKVHYRGDLKSDKGSYKDLSVKTFPVS